MVDNSAIESDSQLPEHMAPAIPPATAEFVKKLYKLLQDETLQASISWSGNGDCFVVKDPDSEFSQTILPPTFGHANFASFVRQLNKYGFHKVKAARHNDDGDLVPQWTFQHPHFHADGPEALHNIKLATPTQAASAGPSTGTHRPASTTASHSSLPYDSSSPSHSDPRSSSSSSNSNQSRSSTRSSESYRAQLRGEITRLQNEGEHLRTRLRDIEGSYATLSKILSGVESTVALQERQMKSILQQFSGNANSGSANTEYTNIASSPSQGQALGSSRTQTVPLAQPRHGRTQHILEYERRMSPPGPISPHYDTAIIDGRRGNFLNPQQGSSGMSYPYSSPRFGTTVTVPPSDDLEPSNHDLGVLVQPMGGVSATMTVRIPTLSLQHSSTNLPDRTDDRGPGSGSVDERYIEASAHRSRESPAEGKPAGEATATSAGGEIARDSKPDPAESQAPQS